MTLLQLGGEVLLRITRIVKQDNFSRSLSNCQIVQINFAKLVADAVSDIGTFIQNVGAAWLMVSLGAGPIYVALTQTASSLPYLLLALPAGSAGDIFDRRKLVLATESWMMGVALLLAVLTIAGFMTWRAILPELVPKDDLAAASALNGIEFNLARAVGPALAGAVIATSCFE